MAAKIYLFGQRVKWNGIKQILSGNEEFVIAGESDNELSALNEIGISKADIVLFFIDGNASIYRVAQQAYMLKPDCVSAAVVQRGLHRQEIDRIIQNGMPDPIAQEFARVCRELSMGASLENVLNSLTQRTENGDMELLTSAVLIQRKAGGNLAEILETVSNTIRERIRLKNHVNTLTAQGRYSGFLVGGIPVFLLVAITNISPDYMSVFYETLYGKILLCVVFLLEFVAFLVIKKMITLE